MTVSIRDGKLRLVMRNTKKADGAPAGGLKGSFNVSLADGNWHTVAISFLPSLNYVNDNVRIAVDGTDLNYASNTWGSSWKAGFNQGAGQTTTCFRSAAVLMSVSTTTTTLLPILTVRLILSP